jgi:hypothetical protein
MTRQARCRRAAIREHLLPAARIGINERRERIGRHREETRRIANAPRRPPNKIEISRFVVELDNIGPLPARTPTRKNWFSKVTKRMPTYSTSRIRGPQSRWGRWRSPLTLDPPTGFASRSLKKNRLQEVLSPTPDRSSGRRLSIHAPTVPLRTQIKFRAKKLRLNPSMARAAGGIRIPYGHVSSNAVWYRSVSSRGAGHGTRT